MSFFDSEKLQSAQKANLDLLQQWGFHAHLDTQSTLTWTLIPRPLGH